MNGVSMCEPERFCGPGLLSIMSLSLEKKLVRQSDQSRESKAKRTRSSFRASRAMKRPR